ADERQPVTVEHEADVDEEDAVAGAAEQEFFFEQLAHAALIGAVADAVVAGKVLIELDFVRAGIGTHFVVDQLENLDAGFRQTRGVFDSVEEQLDEAAGALFFSPQKAHPANALYFATAVVHDHRALAARNMESFGARVQSIRRRHTRIRSIN